MKIALKMNLNKQNEAELSYGNMLDICFASYNMMKMMDSTLPEILCESCDCGDYIEYRFNCEQDFTSDDLNNIFKSIFAEVESK